MNRHNNWALIQEHAPTKIEDFVSEFVKLVVLCTLGYLLLIAGFSL